MNQLEAMRIFVRVAELGSFTQAADGLGLPKASVSTAVKQLEAQLGARLLHRTTRRVQLTQDGQVFYERSQDLLADMEELQTLFQQGEATLSGRLRVDMPSRVARNFVIPRLPAFLARHPALALELSSTDRRVDLVREGFDCVLRVGNVVDTSLIARPVGHFAQLNCASPDYLARFGTPRTLADLAQHRMVHFLPQFGGKPVGWEYVDAAGAQRLPMAGELTVNDADAYEAACLAGLGMIQVPEVGVRHLLASGQLVEVLADYRAEPMPISLLYANRRHLPRRVQVFMDWMVELMAAELR
ncbi:LysR family transcriptional regulator [Chitinimonas sp.]|uniref:LysR family transcriptional regulator n=1 Tax=Chitinimonas sp. TaxID=1934313 RepID=UPI002F928241